MSQTAHTWSDVVEQVFGEFLPVENATPDWLEVPGTGRRLGVDVLFPELGIAIWFKDSRPTDIRDKTAFEGLRADLCRQAGIALVVMEGEVGTHSPTWAQIRTALSAAARRVAQQQGARRAKLDLLPRIASAKAACQQVLAQVSASPAEVERYRRQEWRQWAQDGWQQVRTGWRAVARGPLESLSPMLGAVKRVLLLLAVLLAVNATAYLVANFLDLRGPMAYDFVPDNHVSLADVLAPYPAYLRDLLRGNAGKMWVGELRGSLFSTQQIPILDVIFQRLPKSLVLLGIAVLFSIVVGITTGLLSVNRKTQRTNPLALLLSLAGFSMPGFYMGILVLYIMIRVAMTYGKGVFFLPTTGYGLDRHLVLPALALAVRPTAEISRLTAELLAEELPKDYIRVARAKGLRERYVLTEHAFRNVLAAVMSALSGSWSYLIGSLVIIERVFAWGGLGEALLDAVTFSQYAGSSFNPALVAGLATALAMIFLLADLATGSIARALDPRLRIEGTAA